jgi:hypothetical protein
VTRCGAERASVPAELLNPHSASLLPPRLEIHSVAREESARGSVRRPLVAGLSLG